MHARRSGKVFRDMCATHPRVLLAESGFTETGLALRSLCAERGHALELFFVSKRSNLTLALRTYCPDLALLDLDLFHPDPPAAVSVLHQSAPHIPLILFADGSEQDVAAECLQAGAKDFMLEGHMDGRTLDRVLRSAFSDCPVRLVSQACVDPLTGLMNRAGLVVEAQHWKEAHPLSPRRLLVSIRVQNLEALHLYSGDAKAEFCLSEVALLLREKIRETDLAAHVAPGHFVLLIQDVAEPSLPVVHRRVSDCMSALSERVSLGIQPLLVIHTEFLPSGTSPSFTELLGPGQGNGIQNKTLVEKPRRTGAAV